MGYRFPKGHKPWNKGKHTGVYKGSLKNKVDKAKWQREWRAKHSKEARKAWEEWERKTKYDSQESNRRNHLYTEYRITQLDYDEMFNEQKGLCAICKRKPNEKYFIVDHDHETGRIRGLIHRKCNMAIGLLNDDPTLLRLALEYLEK